MLLSRQIFERMYQVEQESRYCHCQTKDWSWSCAPYNQHYKLIMNIEQILYACNEHYKKWDVEPSNGKDSPL